MPKLSENLAVFGPSGVFLPLASSVGLKTIKLHLRKSGAPCTLRPCDSDAATFNSVFRKGSYDLSATNYWSSIVARYRAIIAKGSVPLIIDAGANVGAASLFFALQFPEARIIAVEPDPGSAAVCIQNLKSANAEVVEAAIGPSVSSATLVRGGTSHAIRTDFGDGPVKVLPIDNLIGRAGPNASLFIVKIDIEGAEQFLFSENTDWTSDAAVIFVEPHDWLFPGRKTSHSMLRMAVETEREVVITGGDTLSFLKL